MHHKLEKNEYLEVTKKNLIFKSLWYFCCSGNRNSLKPCSLYDLILKGLQTVLKQIVLLQSSQLLFISV